MFFPEDLSVQNIATVYKDLSLYLEEEEKVVIDCDTLSRFDFSGLQLLESLRIYLEIEERELNLQNLSPFIQESLKLCGFRELLHCNKEN